MGGVAVDCRDRANRGGGGLEEVPDAAGEVALEAADRFAAGLSFGLFAGEVGGAVAVLGRACSPVAWTTA